MRAPQAAMCFSDVAASPAGFFYGGATSVCALRQGVPLADAFPLRLLLRQGFYRVLGAPLANASPMRSKRLLLRGALCGQGAPLADASPMRRLLCSSAKFLWPL